MHDGVIRELEDAISEVTYDYYRELMDWEGGGYGYMLDADEIDEEVDGPCGAQNYQGVLRYVVDPKRLHPYCTCEGLRFHPYM